MAGSRVLALWCMDWPAVAAAAAVCLPSTVPVAVTLANRGMCHLKLKQYKQAVSDCSASIQLDGAYTKAHLTLI